MPRRRGPPSTAPESTEKETPKDESSNSSTPAVSSGLTRQQFRFVFFLLAACGLVAAALVSKSAPAATPSVPAQASSSGSPQNQGKQQQTARKADPADDRVLRVTVMMNGAAMSSPPLSEQYLTLANATEGLNALGGKLWNNDGERWGTSRFDLREWFNFSISEQTAKPKIPIRVWRSEKMANRHFVWPAHPRVRVLKYPLRSENQGKSVELILISESPRIFFVKNLMHPSEIDAVREYSESPDNPYSMRPSTTGTEPWNSKNFDRAKDQVNTRTSTNAFDTSSENAVRVMKRGVQVLRMNHERVDLMDGLQVVRYHPEQAYNAHYDAFDRYAPTPTKYNFDTTTPTGSNRFATLFLYMNDVESGGQTFFPNVLMSSVDPTTRSQMRELFGDGLYPAEAVGLKFKSPPSSWERSLSRACFKGDRLSLRPQKGGALLFYSLNMTTGLRDPRTLHAACPVVEGIKWGANFWIWSQCRYGQTDDKCGAPLGEDDPEY